MNNLIDVTKIDLRFEKLRLKNPKAEGILLVSIIEKGIVEPLGGILNGDTFLLLDGFKRYRCAIKCRITELPFVCYSQDEITGIVELLKISSSKTLHILEQAKIINQLQEVHHLHSAEIGAQLGKSVFWVRARIILLSEVTPFCLEKIFNGKFPAWCALGKLRQMKRYYKVSNENLDEFVDLVSDKYLSCREIDLLAQGYFSGVLDKEKIRSDDLQWAIDKMKKLPSPVKNLCDSERQNLRDLEITQKYMGRLMARVPGWKKENPDFLSMSTILAEGIINKMTSLETILEKFIGDVYNDKSREK